MDRYTTGIDSRIHPNNLNGYSTTAHHKVHNVRGNTTKQTPGVDQCEKKRLHKVCNPSLSCSVMGFPHQPSPRERMSREINLPLQPGIGMTAPSRRRFFSRSLGTASFPPLSLLPHAWSSALSPGDECRCPLREWAGVRRIQPQTGRSRLAV